MIFQIACNADKTERRELPCFVVSTRKRSRTDARSRSVPGLCASQCRRRYRRVFCRAVGQPANILEILSSPTDFFSVAHYHRHCPRLVGGWGVAAFTLPYCNGVPKKGVSDGEAQAGGCWVSRIHSTDCWLHKPKALILVPCGHQSEPGHRCSYGSYPPAFLSTRYRYARKESGDGPFFMHSFPSLFLAYGRRRSFVCLSFHSFSLFSHSLPVVL